MAPPLPPPDRTTESAQLETVLVEGLLMHVGLSALRTLEYLFLRRTRETSRVEEINKYHTSRCIDGIVSWFVVKLPFYLFLRTSLDL